MSYLLASVKRACCSLLLRRLVYLTGSFTLNQRERRASKPRSVLKIKSACVGYVEQIRRRSAGSQSSKNLRRRTVKDRRRLKRGRIGRRHLWRFFCIACSSVSLVAAALKPLKASANAPRPRARPLAADLPPRPPAAARPLQRA
eukprot:6188132-Pleurochrysis_carterae.AAC.2